jgi:hypothetical protein
MVRIAYVLVIAAALAAGGAARASYPVAGYLIVDRVDLIPSLSPTTIQIWGSFVLAKDSRRSSYAAPVRGCLYYKAPAGKEDLCRKEWNDLKKAAGTGQVIGFGSRDDRTALGKVRKSGQQPEPPDPYPLGGGLVKCDTDTDHEPIRALLALPAPRTPAEGDLVPPGQVTLVVRNIADKKHPRASYEFELTSPSGGKETATVAAGEKETRWTPKLKLKAREKVRWQVRAVDGTWKGPVAASTFVVKGEK